MAQSLQIEGTLISPADPGLLFLFIHNERSGKDAVVSYNFASTELLHRFSIVAGPSPFQSGSAGTQPFALSPDGRWLIVNVTTPTPANVTPVWRQYLYDTQTDSLSAFSFDSSFIYPEQDWSADGQWLARLGDGFLLLSAPGYNYQQVILHPFFDCTNVVWVAE
jgi:hypothetical protein